MVGKQAKFKGKKKKWWRTQTLFWQGEEIKRDSDRYQELITKAYDCLFKNEGFRKALSATNGCVLTHSMVKNKITEIVLTER